MDKYKVYSYKLNNETANLMKKAKICSGKSWNLFLFNTVLEHIKINKESYLELYEELRQVSGK